MKGLSAMNGNNLRIQQLESAVENAKANCEKMVGEFEKAISHYLPVAIKIIVDRAITSNPNVINGMAPEKIKEIKERISQVTTNSNQDAKRITENILWVHRETSNLEKYNPEKTFESRTITSRQIENEIRLIIGQVGKILIDAQIAKSGQEWQIAHGSSSLIYAINYVLPGDIKTLEGYHEAYNALFKEYLNMFKSLEKVKSEISTEEAKKRWDSQ